MDSRNGRLWNDRLWRKAAVRPSMGDNIRILGASSLRCSRSGSGHPASLAGYLGGQVINSGEEQLEDRRSIRLVVADNQVDRWGISSDRTAGYGPRKKIIWVGRQKRYGAGRRDHGHRMGNVVHFMIRNDI